MFRDFRVSQPLISIGLPVYNGERFISQTLDSLLAQDYPDFEIIISDNASADETEAICRAYASKHPRIRYYRPDRNMGAVWNFARVLELAHGEYFMWAAHDDLRHPTYLSRCVAALEENPGALLCCTGVRLIDEAGNDVSETFPFRSYHPIGSTPRERLRALVKSGAWFDTYALMRTRALEQTRIRSNWGGDVVLLAELCLRGEVVAIPEKLFVYRYDPAKTPENVAETVSSFNAAVSVGWSDLAADLMECVGRSTLSLPEKLGLKWLVFVELCIRNPTIGYGVREEGFMPARRALAGGKYQRFAVLASIGLLTQTVRCGERIVNSVRYRSANLRKAIATRSHATSGRKPGF